MISDFLADPSILLGLPDVTAEKVRQALLYVALLIAAISIHEWAHAFTAHRLGDRTPESEDRLTLNPLAHADPIGTLLLPLGLAIASVGVVFGWGRPVNTQPRNYTRKITMRAGMALVAFAGPLSNLLQALATLIIVAILGQTGVIDAVPQVASLYFNLNLILFLFNLLPLHPLDGGKVLGWLLGPGYEEVDEFLRTYGGYIVLALVFVGGGFLGMLFSPFLAWGNFLLDAVV